MNRKMKQRHVKLHRHRTKKGSGGRFRPTDDRKRGGRQKLVPSKGILINMERERIL